MEKNITTKYLSLHVHSNFSPKNTSAKLLKTYKLLTNIGVVFNYKDRDDENYCISDLSLVRIWYIVLSKKTQTKSKENEEQLKKWF